MEIPDLIYLLVSCTSGLCLSSIMSNTTVNVHVQVSEYMHMQAVVYIWNRMTRSCIFILDFMNNCLIVFQSAYMI